MKPCFAYVRVSSGKQEKEGYSIPQQKKRIAEFARGRSLDVVRWFKETHSARHEGDRPQFQAMLADLTASETVRTVVVHKQDRSARNLTDWARLTEHLGVHVYSVEEPVEDTPLGRLTQVFGIGIARFYSDNLAQEVKKGLRGKFEAGGFVTKAPVGYMNVPRTRSQQAQVAVDAERAPLVRLVFERYAIGTYSLRALSEELFDQGLRTPAGKPCSKERVRGILMDPFYKGLTRYGGETRPGLHEAIVPAELWDQVQQVLRRRSRDNGEKGSKFFLLRGLLHCGACGRKMTGEDHPRGSYYRCMPGAVGARCTAPYAPVDELDRLVVARLADVALSADGKAEVLAALDRIDAEHRERRDRNERSLLARREKLSEKLARLTDGFADGTVPREPYVALRTATEAELAEVGRQLGFLQGDLAQDIDAVKAILDTATGIARFYALAPTPQDRKDVLRQVIKRVEVCDREVYRIEYNPPFDLLLGSETAGTGSGMPLERSLLEYLSTSPRGTRAA